MTDGIILIAIAGILAIIVRKKVSDIRAGKSGCGCSGCAGCSGRIHKKGNEVKE